MPVERDATRGEHDYGCCRCDSLCLHKLILAVRLFRLPSFGASCDEMSIVLSERVNALFVTTCTLMSPTASGRYEWFGVDRAGPVSFLTSMTAGEAMDALSRSETAPAAVGS